MPVIALAKAACRSSFALFKELNVAHEIQTQAFFQIAGGAMNRIPARYECRVFESEGDLIAAVAHFHGEHPMVKDVR